MKATHAKVLDSMKRQGGKSWIAAIYEDLERKESIGTIAVALDQMQSLGYVRYEQLGRRALYEVTEIGLSVLSKFCGGADEEYNPELLYDIEMPNSLPRSDIPSMKIVSDQRAERAAEAVKRGRFSLKSLWSKG